MRTENPSQEVFKYQVQNPAEFQQKDGTCNIVALLERVQSDIMKKITTKGYARPHAASSLTTSTP